MSRWKPNTTVAAILEQNGRFLMVEEDTADGRRFNQPAGHLERGESLIEAVVRETLEETGWHFTPTALVGIYLAEKPESDISYLRFAFTGTLVRHDPSRALDDGIIAARWLTHEEIVAQQSRLRSPVVLESLHDYLQSARHPLNLLHHIR